MPSIVKSDTRAKQIAAAAAKKVADAKKAKLQQIASAAKVVKPQAAKKGLISDSGTGTPAKPTVGSTTYKPQAAPYAGGVNASAPIAIPSVLPNIGAGEAGRGLAAIANAVPSVPVANPQTNTMGYSQEQANAYQQKYPTAPSSVPYTYPTTYSEEQAREYQQKYGVPPTPEQLAAENKVAEDKAINAVDQADKGASGGGKDYTPPASKPASGTQTTPGGTGTVPASATTGTPAATGATGTVGTPQAGGAVNQENQYVDQLQTMKFEYDPFSDPDYSETAANLENQVAQMMIGRGGLYSSVASSALSAKLISLQNDMRTQAYERFRQDRDFTLQMAKFTADQMATEWNQNFQLTKFAADQAATQWNQNFQVEQFSFSKEKAAFDQKMAMANYSLSAQAQSFSQSMRIREYNQSVANAAASRAREAAQADLGQQQLLVESNALVASEARKKYNTMYQRVLDTGEFDSETGKYFSAPTGMPMSAYTIKILNKEKWLTGIESQVSADAYNLGMNKTYLDSIGSILSTQGLVSTPKEAAVNKVNYSETTSTDPLTGLPKTSTTKSWSTSGAVPTATPTSGVKRYANPNDHSTR